MRQNVGAVLNDSQFPLVQRTTSNTHNSHPSARHRMAQPREGLALHGIALHGIPLHGIAWHGIARLQRQGWGSTQVHVQRAPQQLYIPHTPSVLIYANQCSRV